MPPSTRCCLRRALSRAGLWHVACSCAGSWIPGAAGSRDNSRHRPFRMKDLAERTVATHRATRRSRPAGWKFAPPFQPPPRAPGVVKFAGPLARQAAGRHRPGDRPGGGRAAACRRAVVQLRCRRVRGGRARRGAQELPARLPGVLREALLRGRPRYRCPADQAASARTSRSAPARCSTSSCRRLRLSSRYGVDAYHIIEAGSGGQWRIGDDDIINQH
jgi:hypothetical protein